MTATLPASQRELWNSMPGWGIAADLTPPEILATRKLRRNIRYAIICLAVVVGLIILGYAYAWWQNHGADGELEGAQNQQSELQARVHKYDNVVQIQGTISQVRQQISTLLGNDTDVSQLVKKIVGAAPGSVAVTDLDVEIRGLNVGVPPVGSLDTSHVKSIGSVTIKASGARLGDSAAYVQSLAKVPGLIDVFPTKNSAERVSTTFEITASVTEKLLTHRFDATPPKGAK